MTQRLQQDLCVPRLGLVYGLAAGIATWLIIAGVLVLLGGIGEPEAAGVFCVSILIGVFAGRRPAREQLG
jgi:hypothetical protein